MERKDFYLCLVCVVCTRLFTEDFVKKEAKCVFCWIRDDGKWIIKSDRVTTTLIGGQHHVRAVSLTIYVFEYRYKTSSFSLAWLERRAAICGIRKSRSSIVFEFNHLSPVLPGHTYSLTITSCSNVKNILSCLSTSATSVAFAPMQPPVGKLKVNLTPPS